MSRMSPTAAKLSPEQRREIVIAMLTGRVAVRELAREHQVSPTILYRWRDQFLEAGLRGLQGDGPTERERSLERELSELRELVGDLAVANYSLKKVGASGAARNGKP